MLYVGVACVLGVFPASGSTAPSRSTLPARTLTFEERVQAQDAIERVYYSHQTGTTEPFEKVVSRAILENKVRKYLQQSVALERIWSTPVTGEMLHREMERIRTGTRFPGRLAEVIAALGNDPFLLEECFARPVLVDHLARSFFDSDERIHGDSRRQAENLRALLTQGGLDPATEHPLRSVIDLKRKGDEPLMREKPDLAPGDSPDTSEFAEARGRAPERIGEIGPIQQEHDHWAVRVVLSEGSQGARVATYSIPRITWDAWWDSQKHGLDPLEARAVSTAAGSASHAAPMTPQPESASGSCTPADTWVNGGLDDFPDLSTNSNPAVWTGTVMVVKFGRYDPLIDRWSSVSRTNAVTGDTAVWTGQEVLYFGGCGGGRYNPVTDTWSSMANIGPPCGGIGRSQGVAVWTGSRMIIWGGWNGAAISDGYLYDPVTNTWPGSVTLVNRPPGAVAPKAVWTGTRMLVWGGLTSPNGQPLNTGGAYDPLTNTWSTITTQGAPSARSAHTAIWTGNRMIVWGGSLNGPKAGDGASYDPFSNTWQALPAGGPSPRSDHTAVWTGNRMIIWGGTDGNLLSTGAAYNPASNSWSATSQNGAPSARTGHVAVWTGDRMVVWGGGDPTGGRYDPENNQWTPTSMNGTPPFVYQHVSVWTGNLMLVAGSGLLGGARYDPLSDSWSLTSTSNAPSAYSPTAVWTGTRMIVWGGTDSAGQVLNTGARYDPLGDAWTSVTTTNAPQARSNYTAIWTGSRMIVWGGNPSPPGAMLNTGGSYNPANNSWSATSTNNAPTGRSLHSAVWTGSRMVVWGGVTGSGSSTIVNTGAQYNPTNNSWSPTSTTNAPTPRWSALAVWTGNDMVVWGGGNEFGNPLITGGRYDPGTDAWQSITNAPFGQVPATAIWTGNRMIVWGASGSMYDPTSDSWAAISTVDAPLQRYRPTAVWTGDLMIIWGGTASGVPSRSGGAYSPEAQVVDMDGDTFACDVDCNDASASIHPGAVETCDGIDQNCDGVLDDGFPDSDQDGYASCGGDCNDANSSVHPGAAEICDGADDDCDGTGDDLDRDGDGFSVCGGDCNDQDLSMHPGAAEFCDTVDNDCDGSVDEGFDLDSDGWASCLDCDDANPAVYPGAVEICNGMDEDCDGYVDEGFPDSDGDGYDDCQDCDDANPFIHPLAFELCDGLDNNCNNLVDDRDSDLDGHGACFGDCSDFDPTVWGVPLEVPSLDLVSQDPLSWSWLDEAPSVGPSVVYDVPSGTLGPGTGVIFPSGSCMGTVSSPGFTDVRPDPNPGHGYWFLVRARNSCGACSYGLDGQGNERSGPSCP